MITFTMGHAHLLFVLVLLATIALPSAAQYLEIQSSWTYDDSTHEVEMFAASHTDYNSEYYYYVGVAAVIDVYPNGPDDPSHYTVCNVSAASSEGDASVSCAYTFTGAPYLALDSTHNMEATYYVYQVLPECYGEGCYDWADYYGYSWIEAGRPVFTVDSILYPLGSLLRIGYAVATTASLLRDRQAGECTYPVGENTVQFDFYPYLNYIAQFEQQLLGAGSFTGRRVREELSNYQNSCAYEGSEPLPLYNQNNSGEWVVGRIVNLYGTSLYTVPGWWGYDNVGFLESAGPLVVDYINHLRMTQTSTCSIAFNQQMTMYCGPLQRTSYGSVHPLYITIMQDSTSATLVVSRAEATASRRLQ